MTQMALQPRGEFGSPLTKSIVIFSHFQSSIGRGCSSPTGLRCSALTCWHYRHRDTNSTISFFMLGHQNVSFKNRYIFVSPECIINFVLWAFSKTCILISGIFGIHKRSQNSRALFRKVKSVRIHL